MEIYYCGRQSLLIACNSIIHTVLEWPWPLTHDLDFQSPESYDHDRYIHYACKKNQGQRWSVKKWVETDGQTDTTDLLPFSLTLSVIKLKLHLSCFLFLTRHFSCADKATGPVCLCVLITCELNDLWHAAQINKSYSLRGANMHLLSNNWFLGPTQICPQNSISIRSIVFARLARLPKNTRANRYTQRPRHCVCTSRPLFTPR